VPIHYQIDSSRREVLVRVSGVVSDHKLLDEVERLLNDPRFPEAPRVIWDARDRGDVPDSNVIEPMLALIGRHQPSVRGARCALVAARLASFGMQRMFSVRADSIPFEVRAFRDLAEARSWLHDSPANGATWGGRCS
jgi:hypothetical protein